MLQTREGLQALAIAREHRPDLILMDIQLPEISGLEVTKWLKDDEELNHIPVIAVTAFAMKGDEERICQGAVKPTSPSRSRSFPSWRQCAGTWGRGRHECADLVVDDVEANVRLLEAKLTLEYYDVLTCHDGATAIATAGAEQPDLILLDVMMPGMDGFETCRRIKAAADTRHIPVVLVTALDGRHDRIKGLEAGADDFLSKPLDDVILMARVRSLTRLKMVMDELREREESGRRVGVDTGGVARLKGSGGRVLIVDDNTLQAQVMAQELSREHRPLIEPSAEAGLETARGPVDLVIVNITSERFDGLRLIAQLRSKEPTRRLPILAVVDTQTGRACSRRWSWARTTS